jgi:phospholipid transport system substrate-binding protein
MTKKVFALLVLLCLYSGAAFADDDLANVKASVEKMANDVLGTLKQEGIDKKVRDEKVIEIVSPLFDFKRMAKLSLGKKHWKPLSKEKQKEYSDLMVARVQESYLEKLDIYTDEKVIMGEAKEVKKRIHIKTILISKDERIDIVYKFYKTDSGWKVYDIVILGVSIVQTYRSQFSDVLKTGTIDDLLAKLKTTGQFSVPTPGDSGK